MINDKQDRAMFVSFSIEQYAKAKNMTIEEAVSLFERYGIAKHFYDFYESLIFEKPTEEWVKFVMKNRTERGFAHDYDIVYGPVADDSVYTQFTLYEGGIISLPTLIQELKTYKLVDQYLFHTEKSLLAIKFVESKEIKL